MHVAVKVDTLFRTLYYCTLLFQFQWPYRVFAIFLNDFSYDINLKKTSIASTSPRAVLEPYKYTLPCEKKKFFTYSVPS